MSIADDDDLEEELDKAIHTHYEEAKGNVVIPLEEYIKSVYYRFDKQRFFKNSCWGPKSRVPYMNE